MTLRALSVAALVALALPAAATARPSGTPGPDSITVRSAAGQEVHADGGPDRLTGGPGPDRLFGETGSDVPPERGRPVGDEGDAEEHDADEQ